MPILYDVIANKIISLLSCWVYVTKVDGPVLIFTVKVPRSPSDSGVSDLDSSNSSDEAKRKHSLLKTNGNWFKLAYILYPCCGKI